MPHLDRDDRRVLEASDELVERWRSAARAGAPDAERKLLLWAYATARSYYTGKLGIEQALAPEDVDELTTDFFLEFQRRLPRIRTVTHYTRRVLKSRLQQYLVRKRRRYHREPLRPNDELERVLELTSPGADRPWEAWSDEEWSQYRLAARMLNEADEMTRSIVIQRIQGVPYRDMARRLRLSEAALRMRVSRFYKAVRDHFEESRRT